MGFMLAFLKNSLSISLYGIINGLMNERMQETNELLQKSND
jgi:hypothetical protein